MTVGVAGVDLALRRTGVATEDGAYAVTVGAKLPEARRVRYMVDQVVEVAGGRRVVLEGQFATGNNAAILLGLHWHFRAELDRIGTPPGHVLVVTPEQVAIMATGRARAVPRPGESKARRRARWKAEIVAAVSERTGVEYPGDDEAEAVAARCIGLELLGLPHPMGDLPHSRRRAIANLEWPMP